MTVADPARSIRCNQRNQDGPCQVVIHGDTPADRLAKMGAHVAAVHGLEPRKAMAEAAGIETCETQAVERENENSRPATEAPGLAPGVLACPEHPSVTFARDLVYRLVDHVEAVHGVAREQALTYVRTVESGQTPLKTTTQLDRCSECGLRALYPSQHGKACSKRAGAGERAPSATERLLSTLGKEDIGGGLRQRERAGGDAGVPGQEARRGRPERPERAPAGEAGEGEDATKKARRVTGRPLKDIDQSDFKDRRASGESWGEIAKDLGVHRNTLLRRGVKGQMAPSERSKRTRNGAGARRVNERAKVLRDRWKIPDAPSNGHVDVAAEIKRLKGVIADAQAQLDAIRAALDGDGPDCESRVSEHLGMRHPEASSRMVPARKTKRGTYSAGYESHPDVLDATKDRKRKARK